MRQFKRTWGDHDDDRDDFHFGDFPGHSHRPRESHGGHGHHDSPCQPGPQPAKIEYRSFDGSQNNQSDSTLNAAGTEFGRIGEAHFADGISVPLGGNNPRTISNLVVGAGDPDVANPEGVSAFMYAWGQFIDHDMTLTRTDGVSDISVVVPAVIPCFPPAPSFRSPAQSPIPRPVQAHPTQPWRSIPTRPGSTPRWSMGPAPRPPPACAPPTATC
jgi:peroxidase